MKKNKWLYQFKINREVDKKVTEKQKDDKGQEIEVTKTVTETVPIEFSLKKPNRKLYDNAELFYGVKMSEGIKAGLLTRNLLSKRYEDDGGAFSENEKQRYSEIYMEIYAKESEYQRLQTNLDNKPQELKERISQDILLEISELRRELIEIENSQANIFDQTAENRAKNQTIMWWVLELSHWKEYGRESETHFFEGENFDEKLETYDEFEESDDPFLNEAIKKLAFFVSFWYMGRATTQEEFQAVEELYDGQNETEEDVPEVEESEEVSNADEVAEKAEEEAPAKEETPKQTKAKKKPKVKKQQEAKKEEESTEESPSVSEAVAKEDTKVSGEASNPLKTNED